MSDTINLIDEQTTIALAAGPKGATGDTGATGPTGPAGGDATTATIDLTSTGDTTIYTVPSGKKFIPSSIRIITKTLALDGVDATLTYLADVDTLRAAFQTTAVAVDKSEKVTNISDADAYNAGDIIKATVTIAATHSIHTVTATLEGILYDA